MHHRETRPVIDAELFARLAAPFAADEVGWKPQTVSKDQTKALAICFVDARAVMDRLDEVLGPMGWEDRYEILPDGCAVCTLRVRAAPGGEWVTKTDVGGPSDQKDPGDRRKAAFSDAIKRAAVKLGIGRYLYRLGGEWVPYDAQRRRLKAVPKLPAWALPARREADPAPAPPGGEAEEADQAELVSRGQAQELAHLIKQAGVEPAVWCAFYGVKDTEDLPARRYEAARKKLLLTIMDRKEAAVPA
jgi:hypothetical protein